MFNFKKFSLKSFAKICVALLIYGGGAACAIYSQLLANEDKATYRKDIDYQYERMLEYDVKPYSGRTTGKLGGDHFASINYGKLILFLLYFMCIIYNTEIAKSTYRHDVDYQVSRFQEYHVKPIQIDKTDRLGGYYSVYLYYGDISDKELDSVILDLYNDGFIEYSDKHNKKFHKNNVSVVVVHNNDKSIEILVSVYERKE